MFQGMSGNQYENFFSHHVFTSSVARKGTMPIIVVTGTFLEIGVAMRESVDMGVMIEY